MRTWMGTVLAVASIALFTFFSAEARAASLKDMPEPLPGYSWTGFYIGGHIGYGDGDADLVFATKDEDGHFWNMGHGIDGWLGGVQVGYDLQYGALVFGLVFDWSGTNIDGHRRNPRDGSNFIGIGDPVNGPPVEFTTELKNIVSLRSRTGYLFKDYFLVYVHAGLAYGQFELTGQGGPANDFSPQKDWRRGYVGGVGAEIMLFDGVTVFAEYSHYKFDESDLFLIADGDDFKGDVNNEGRDLDVIKVGANVRF